MPELTTVSLKVYVIPHCACVVGNNVSQGMEQGLQDLGSHRGPALIEMRGLEIAASVGSSVCRLFIDNMAEG
jgi:hypothetical protein